MCKTDELRAHPRSDGADLVHSYWMFRSKFQAYCTSVYKHYLGCSKYCVTVSLDEFWEPVFLTNKLAKSTDGCGRTTL